MICRIQKIGIRNPKRAQKVISVLWSPSANKKFVFFYGELVGFDTKNFRTGKIQHQRQGNHPKWSGKIKKSVSKIRKSLKKTLLTPTSPSLKMRFSKNTHKPDIFTISNPVKRDDVSIPILKVSPGQDLGTQLQKKKLAKSTKCVPEMVSAHINRGPLKGQQGPFKGSIGDGPTDRSKIPPSVCKSRRTLDHACLFDCVFHHRAC